MNEKNNLSNNTRGMTLVEVLAVIVILGLILTVVARNVIGKSEDAKAKLNDVKMENLINSIGLFRLEYNTLPASLAEMAKPSSATQGKTFTPFAKDDDLKDVWGNEFLYRTENNKRTFALTTLGSDGVQGGEGAKGDVTKTGP